MKMFAIALALLVVPLSVQAQPKTPLEGEWTQAADGTGFKIVFTGDRATLIKPNGVFEAELKFTVRPDKKLAEIDFHVEKSKKFTLPGIYKIEEKGMQLTVAYSTLREKAVRPTVFVGGGDNDVRVYVLHKTKAKVAPPKPKIEKTVLEGQWSGMPDGTGYKLRVVGNKMLLTRADGENENDFTFVVRADKGEIDISTVKANMKLTTPGIFKIEDDGKRLLIAWSERDQGGVRPTEYVVGGDNDVRVMILYRKKAK